MNVLITGANRGIGLGLTDHYLMKGAKVFACTRNPDGSRELWEREHDYKDHCRLVRLDVTDENDLAALPDALGDEALDLVINNAGILPAKDSLLQELSAESLMKTFRVNVIGPMLVAQKLIPALRRSKKPILVTLTSKMGSIDDNSSGGNYAYRISKTAVNMLNRNLAHELKGIICVALHPGWVVTEMGGPNAPLSIDTSVNGLSSVIAKLELRDSGRFLDYQGVEIPW